MIVQSEMKSIQADVVVIGGGPAGVVAAARAADLGARTVMVTGHEIGGMAADDGPVPVRTLAHAARLIRDARQLGAYGINVTDPVLDYPRLLTRVREVGDDVRGHSALREQIEEKGGVVHEHAGLTQFIDAQTVVTESGLRLTAAKFIICTGGVSKKLPIAGYEHTSTHSDAWRLTDVPSSMIVIGGGATGIQVASVFNSFGTRVQVFEALPNILAAEDHDVSSAVAVAFRQAGVIVNEGFGAIESFDKTSTGVRMNFSKDCQTHSAEAELVVVAAGWGADTNGMNLEAAGIAVTQRGFLAVDEHLQTSASTVFAAGDVTGRLLLASEAMRDGFIAATNAVHGSRMAASSHITPTGSFTDPEYASVGLTELKARADYDVETAVVDYASLTRAIIDGQTVGFCKLIVDRATNDILGCHVVGERAIEIVQVAAVALAAGLTQVDELAQVAVSFPTYAQILILAAVKAAQQLNIDIGWRAMQSG
ncbi:dihydrolipoyl dehydrogenase [soil metagenome]